MKINSNNEDNDTIIIAMEVGYQALADLVSLYKQINRELLKQLSIMYGKSTKEIKQKISEYLMVENQEKDLLLKIKASQELINRYNTEEDTK